MTATMTEMAVTMTRVLRRALGVAVGAAAVVALASAAAHAAPSASPSPAPEKTVQLSSDVLPDPIVFSSITDSKLYARLVGEVSWLSTAPGVTKSPAEENLGVKVAMVLATEGKTTQRYDLYPLADGGPRAFRPAVGSGKHKIAAAWFYGRLSMPATLSDAGVPLGIQPGTSVGNAGQGGQGGGVQESTAAHGPADVVADWRHLVNLNGLVVLAIAVAVFLIAFAVRRRI